MGKKPSGGKQRLICNGREVEDILTKAGYEVKKCPGSHRKCDIPGEPPIVFHVHGDTGPGLAKVWTTRLKMLGLLFFGGLVLAGWLWFYATLA